MGGWNNIRMAMELILGFLFFNLKILDLYLFFWSSICSCDWTNFSSTTFRSFFEISFKKSTEEKTHFHLNFISYHILSKDLILKRFHLFFSILAFFYLLNKNRNQKDNKVRLFLILWSFMCVFSLLSWHFSTWIDLILQTLSQSWKWAHFCNKRLLLVLFLNEREFWEEDGSNWWIHFLKLKREFGRETSI